MIIKKINVEKFRGIQNQSFALGEKITIIVGQNGTMKTTMLGMISQPFSMRKSNMRNEKTLDGVSFESKFQDKFKWSPKYDLPGDHLWSITYSKENEDSDSVYELKSAVRSKKEGNTKLRFVNARGKRRKDSYIEYPVIYLSLKRVTPIGEEHNEKLNNPLTEKEKEFYVKAHNNILSIMDEITDVNSFETHNKNSLLVDTQSYDCFLNSAGQDNIGKIIGSIISFKRLQEKYPNDYTGGLLVIDEVDATLFPSAQELLMDFLLHWASKLKLQIVLTTHSFNVIKKAYDKNFKNVTKLIYLKKTGGNIIGHEGPTIDDIIADLNILISNKNTTKKTRLYLEDPVGYIFVTNLLSSSLKKRLEIMKNVSLGAENYLNLVESGVKEFKTSLIVLDGDKEKDLKKKRYKKYKNFVSLPTNSTFPESFIYDYLFSLEETNAFWNNNVGGYSKQVCFRSYIPKPEDKAKIKQWFQEQKRNWGNNCNKVFKQWKESNSQIVEHFTKQVEDILTWLE